MAVTGSIQIWCLVVATVTDLSHGWGLSHGWDFSHGWGLSHGWGFSHGNGKDVCSLPKVTGPCFFCFPRYYFNKQSGQCQKFEYGGCGGNANRFKTLEECENTCGGKDVCSKPKDSGPCNANFPRYYFNKKSGQCGKFVYGGCDGNANRFKTFKECQTTCGGINVCSQPKDSGPCNANFPRYYFNKKSGQCGKFVYGGCDGNANRFKTLEECQTTCGGKDVCSQPKDSGPCNANFPRYYFNKKSRQCGKFVYGGCGGNANRFKTFKQCQTTCGGKDACSQPKDSGPCNGNFPRYYFNKKSGQCGKFVYGGCDGNANRFKTLEECQTTCRGKNVCSQPKDSGPCNANFPRYYFNKKSGQCGKFVYGGCGGNTNRFKTFKECQTTCGGKDVCSQPKDSGPCNANFPRYYFNKKSGQCGKFVYGGCGGNANRFKTFKECQTTCGGKDVCSQPKDSGPCNAKLPRYYFNKKSGQCGKFVYGGCGGNANRFKTFMECQTTCADVCSQPKDSGPCNANFPMYYFNKKSGQCGKFVYGGCDGNANRFKTFKECQTACGGAFAPIQRY